MKLDIKTWFILILGTALIISLWFLNKSNTSNHKQEIQALHKQNELLLKKNDSLDAINLQLDKNLKVIQDKLRLNEGLLVIQDNKIKELNKNRISKKDQTKALDADGIAEGLTNYIKKK